MAAWTCDWNNFYFTTFKSLAAWIRFYTTGPWKMPTKNSEKSQPLSLLLVFVLCRQKIRNITAFFFTVITLFIHNTLQCLISEKILWTAVKPNTIITYLRLIWKTQMEIKNKDKKETFEWMPHKIQRNCVDSVIRMAIPDAYNQKRKRKKSG